MHKFLSAIFIYLFLSLSVQADDVKDALTAYQKNDFKTALKLLKPLANQGGVVPQFFVGYIYYNGHGVKRDYKQAIKWFMQSAEQGNVDAQTNLGFMYKNGQGVEQDYKQAVKWYRLAAE